MKTDDLIHELIALTEQNREEGEYLKKLPLEYLQRKKNQESWSALECIEHLNRYGDFYIPEIDFRLSNSNHGPTQLFNSGILGNYFAQSMLPKEKPNRMKTFRSMNPIHSNLEMSTVNTFIKQQDQLLELLERARHTNLTKVRTSVSISKWIKLRLGDTLRVVVYHNLRHIKQAKRAISFESGSLNN